MKFFKTDNGKLVAVLAGIALFLLVLSVITPKSINLIINSGEEPVISFKSAKKTIKRKRRKNKKDKKNNS